MAARRGRDLEHEHAAVQVLQLVYVPERAPGTGVLGDPLLEFVALPRSIEGASPDDAAGAVVDPQEHPCPFAVTQCGLFAERREILPQPVRVV